MLRIYVGERLLDLPDNVRIRIKRSNPAYLGEDVGVVKSGFSYPFDLPLTPNNREILNYPDRLDNQAQLPEDLPMRIYAGPDLFMVGRLTVLRSTRTIAKVSFHNNPLADLSKVKLSEVSIGGYSYATADALQANMRDSVINPTARPWCAFPVYNLALNPREDLNTNDDQFQNAYNFSTGSFRQDLPISLFLRAEFVLRAIMEAQGYTWTDLFHVTEEHQRICLVNNRTLNLPGGVLTLAAGYNTLMPETTVAQFLKDYCRIFNLAPFSTINGDAVTLQPLADLVATPERKNWSSYASNNHEKKTGGSLFKLSFPDNAGGSKGLQGKWGDLGKPDFIVEFIIDNPTEGVLYYLLARNVYVRGYAQEDGSFLGDFTYSNGSIENPRGEDEILPTIGTVRQDQLLFYPDATDNLIVPYWSRELAPPVRDTDVGGTEVAHSLAIYRGLQPTSAGRVYPFAGFNNYQVDFSRIADEELTLRWLGDRGLYDNHWREWDDMLQRSDVVQRSFLLPLTELLSFDFRDKVRVGNRNYFVRDLEFSISGQGVSPTSCTMIAVS